MAVALSAGLLMPRTRRLAGGGAVVFFLVVWLANIHVAPSGAYAAGLPQSPVQHGVRVPFQLLYIGSAARVEPGHVPGWRLRKRMMARRYDRTMRRDEAWMAPRKQGLFEDLQGRVFELGPGTGAPYPNVPKENRWIGLERNEPMHAAPGAPRATAKSGQDAVPAGMR